MAPKSELLVHLKQLRLIRPLDYQFARFIEQEEGGDEPGLVLLAALASFQLSRGEVCLPLLNIDSVMLEWPRSIQQVVLQSLPNVDQYQGLLQFKTISDGSIEAPLVISDRRLYLYRYWHYETFVSDKINHLAEPVVLDQQAIRAGLQQLFSDSTGADETDWQQVAVAIALSRRFSVISGGPGTGKTTTVTKLLGLFVEQARQRGQSPLIRLAAPTGKAAARLSESIGAARNTLPLSQDTINLIPGEASTLHRLLGPIPNSKQFRHHRDNPLHLDLLVVDEASMIDLPMMARLLDALPAQASVIFIGDKDQLASVEAGSVLGDICGWERGGQSGALQYGIAQSQYLAEVCAIDNAEVAGGQSAIADCLALLRKSYRFRGDSGIGRLAGLINGGDQQGVAALFHQAYPDIHFNQLNTESYDGLIHQAVTGYAAYLSLIKSGGSPEQVLRSFNQIQLLAMVRQGPYGIEGLNKAIEQQLQMQRLIPSATLWYPGRPIMISRNDYQVGLYNGDIGIAITDDEGVLRVWFEQADGTCRGILPSRLPEHETVYAMTVHKSQGSEFEDVLLLLPPELSPLLTRELLYTGVTRAKQAFSLYSTQGALQHAISQRTERASGLANRLW